MSDGSKIVDSIFVIMFLNVLYVVVYVIIFLHFISGWGSAF